MLIVVREGRLTLFGHVNKREGKRLLGEVIELKVHRLRPRGRPRKQWNHNIEVNSREMNLLETDAIDRVVRPFSMKKKTLNLECKSEVKDARG